MAKYDEDLHDNPFFITLSEKFPDLFDLASEKCWMICVPRFETVLRSKIYKQDVETHILLPEKELEVPDEEDSKSKDQSMAFVTLNGKYLSIQGEYIVTGCGFKEERRVKILFDESFFNSKDQSYQVLCIDKQLEGGPEEQPMMVASLETLSDCHDFLWNHNDPACEKVKKTVDSYLSSLTVKIDSTPDQIKDIAFEIYETALAEISKLPHIRKLHSGSGKNFFALATETYILNKIHSQLFRLLCRTELGDSDINKYTRKACDVHFADLGIRQEYSPGLSKAREHLLNLNKCSSPFEKTRCFKQTVSSLGAGSTAKGLTADELLPILVYLVLKSEIPNWKVNLFYIQQFHFSNVGSEEILYYLTSFEAAVEYITTKSLENSISINRARFYCETETLTVTRLRSFFDSVAREDVESVEKLLKLPDDISMSLCHPLCHCEKCAPIVSNYHDDPARVSIYSRDSLKRTGLHYAALMGQAIIIQRLLELKSDIDAVDINHHTPLHLACLHGNQKCVLFLLSEGASINKMDRGGNTPLHLACSHGHEECVKALVFNKEKCNVNHQNSFGDTPLHLAARWNYGLIVPLLLEHGAQFDIRNKLNDTPARASYNTKIFVNLQSLASNRHSSFSAGSGGRGGEGGRGGRRASEKEETDGGRASSSDVKLRNSDSLSRNPTKSIARRRSTLSSDAPSETDKQLKKLFRAIHDHDITMVKYLFGNQTTPTEGGGGATACHPLCQCEKCQKLRKGHLVFLNVNVRDSHGNTPLHKAALNGSRAIVDYLISRDAPKNARTKDELLTPLHLACQYNHKDVVMKLLENGADVNPSDVRGNTPLHFCCNNGHMDSAALLLIHGADVTALNDRGDTPLHNAARWNHASLAKELILYGAQYSHRNNEDKTPDDLTTDEEVHHVIKQAMSGEISIGAYKPLSSPPHAGSPNISDDDDFEHI